MRDLILQLSKSSIYSTKSIFLYNSRHIAGLILDLPVESTDGVKILRAEREALSLNQAVQCGKLVFSELTERAHEKIHPGAA